jgi:hypothetical protein
MKLLKQNNYLLIPMVLFATACQKHTYYFPKSKCVITHTQEDLYGTSLDITYNQKGDPATLKFSNTTATVLYDASGRLSKVNFDTTGIHLDYIYNNNTFLPAVVQYYRPADGGLISIDSFCYNTIGELVKKVNTDLQRTSNNNVQNFEYDYKGNLKKVTITANNGGTKYCPAVTAFEATRYDSTYNFMAGNQWIKYVLFYSDMEDFGYLLFSVNNALDWKWGYTEGNAYTVTSTTQYNADGFAKTITGHYFDKDGVTALTDFTRVNTSTCDTTNNSLHHSNNKILYAYTKSGLKNLLTAN